MRRGIPVIMMLAGLGVGVAATALWWPHFAAGLAGAIAARPVALVLHLLGAGLFASGAAAGMSRPMKGFYFLLVAVLPLIGMLAVLGLNHHLSADGAAEEDEGEFELGNPILARRGGQSLPELSLDPIVRVMRQVDSRSLGKMILGLSQSGSAERGYQILRRFQQDEDVELQFYAQNAQRGATESLERQLKRLRLRLADAPGDPLVSSALAEVLIDLAGRRTTSGSDANAYVRRALEHLKQVPEGAKRAAMEVRGYLLVRDPAAARAAFGRLPEADSRRARLEVEVLYAERDWGRLAACCEGLESADIPLRTARAFWRGRA